MPRSSKARPLPEEPDFNEIIQNDVTKLKRLLGLDINRLAIGSAIENVVYDTGYAQNFDYTITGVNVIEFVNVSTSIVIGTQTGALAGTTPAQVTGLVVSVIGDNQLNLSWSVPASAPAIINYKVYSSTTNGFTPVSPIASPVTNSYPNTGLSAGNTYYYRVSAVNANGEGTVSAQGSGTTTGTFVLIPQLDMRFDNNFNDSSPNNHTVTGSNSNGFIAPGIFGTHAWRVNFPVQPPSQPDTMQPGGTSLPVSLEMDTSVGFSISFWINPQDLSALSFRRVIMEKPLDANNKWSIQIEGGTAYFLVKKAGVEYKRQKTGFVTGSWQHVCAVFNGATNTVELYRDAVAGAASVVTGQYPYAQSEGGSSFLYWSIGYRVGGGASPDGTGFDTHYEGYLDEVKYYKSVVLTPTQVTNLKNTNAP